MKPSHLTLISHALTEAQRLGRFHVDDLLDSAAKPLLIEKGINLLAGPELRTTRTAGLLRQCHTVEMALRDCYFGRWEGLLLKALEREEPALLQEWLTNPHASPNGGESIKEVCRRVALWLDGFTDPGHWCAVTHPMIVRAAMMHVLQSPLVAFHHIDVQPLSQLHLGRNGRWRLKLTA